MNSFMEFMSKDFKNSTLGAKSSNSPFCIRQSRCWVWSPPIQKLRQWRGTNILSHNWKTMSQNKIVNLGKSDLCNYLTGMGWDSRLFNLAWGLLFMCREPQAAPDVRIGGGQRRRAPKKWSKLGGLGACPLGIFFYIDKCCKSGNFFIFVRPLGGRLCSLV